MLDTEIESNWIQCNSSIPSVDSSATQGIA